MKSRTVLLFFNLTLALADGLAQLPPQTVVFTVRKNQKPVSEEIRVEVVSEKWDPPYIIVEENALFQGGDVNSFRNWVQKNIKYPPAPAEAGISGKVFVEFCVNPRGQVCDVKVLRGVHPDIDREAVRCINASPVWKPAKNGGMAVKQQFVMPLIFQLQD